MTNKQAELIFRMCEGKRTCVELAFGLIRMRHTHKVFKPAHVAASLLVNMEKHGWCFKTVDPKDTGWNKFERYLWFATDLGIYTAINKDQGTFPIVERLL